nr:MAG TPA: major capsid protein [Caudoviricetes sp.]
MNKEELLKKLDAAKTEEELKEIRSQLESLNNVEEKKKQLISEIEERDLIRNTQNEIETRKFVKVDEMNDKKGEKAEKRSLAEILKSPEYRTAWAKTLLNRKLDEKEERALGDAVTTTATEYTASAAETQGINNGGLFIPTDVRTDMLRIIEETSPFLRDVRKLAVSANIDMPYLNAADDAEWYAELEDTKNEGAEYKSLSLTGHELAKQVEITWKLEAMAVEEFIAFITKELANKMARALATAVLYGDGDKKPTGALKDAIKVTGTEVIETMINTYAQLPSEMKVGAKAYLSSALAIQVVGFKDNNGNYPYLQGLNKTALFEVEVDPFLKDEDMIVGNPQNYVLNTVQQISVNQEKKITQRRTTYSTYAIYDGKPYPKAFNKGNVNAG